MSNPQENKNGTIRFDSLFINVNGNDHVINLKVSTRSETTLQFLDHWPYTQFPFIFHIFAGVVRDAIFLEFCGLIPWNHTITPIPKFHFGRIQEDPGSIQGPLRISRDNLGGVMWWSDFSRNPGEKAKWAHQKLIVRKSKAKGDTDPRKVNS